ncbi:MAG TPA: chaperone modulator CbpM [Streptosporangiaceae bacterium]
MSQPPVRAVRLDLEDFARAAGAHPELVRRLVAAGVLDARRDQAGTLWFSPAQLATLGRIQRLRAAFMLNYAALGLVLDLLDRIEQLQAALSVRPPLAPGPPAGTWPVRPPGG